VIWLLAQSGESRGHRYCHYTSYPRGSRADETRRFPVNLYGYRRRFIQPFNAFNLHQQTDFVVRCGAHDRDLRNRAARGQRILATPRSHEVVRGRRQRSWARPRSDRW